MGGEEEALEKKHYQPMEELGRGKFGTVFRCFHQESNKSYAVKVINKNLLTGSTDRQCLESESKFMTFLSPHPNILQIFETFEDADYLCMVLELCGPHALIDKLPLPEPEACSVMKSLLEALAHCHRLGIAHRDVKPDNILFDESGNLKVADFGFAEWCGEGRSMSGVVGTPYYVAPEVVMRKEYTEKVDVWSAGVVLYAMLSGIPPFDGDSPEDIFAAVARANLRFPTSIFSSVSAPAKDLLRKMICRDPSRRISAEQALRHPWILSGGVINQ
ncbi:phosphoenolpyruvate carboxylase kinase 2-like [Lotus japonicus]|uniref:phosphoenolpyruvate carboxylase kinase 2-like n=1 Tax=Lotus japonicus TaxID=34305 RepID=UPI002583D047|nr:phosphoenolpyruvate carboxylase kinase 2-like [Lotus japonicus]